MDGYSFLFSSRRRHTRLRRDWSSDVCSSDLATGTQFGVIRLNKLGSSGNLVVQCFKKFTRPREGEVFSFTSQIIIRAHFKTKHRFISDSHGTILSLWESMAAFKLFIGYNLQPSRWPDFDVFYSAILWADRKSVV